jgi:hypothetical protein
LRKWFWPAIGLLGLVLFLLLSPVANPEAQVDLNVTRQQSIDLSRAFLEQQGFALAGYESAASFASDDQAVVYLQRTFPLAESNRLAREQKVWQWSVRWYMPGEQTEYRVAVDTAAPAVLGFSRERYPEAEAGARLGPEEARRAAERFLEGQGYRTADWLLVGQSSRERPARVDHHFEWQRRERSVGEALLKVNVDIEGDRPASLRAYLLVPEPFRREYSRQSSLGSGLATVSVLFIIGLWVLAVVLAIKLSMRGRAAWGLGLWGAVLLGVLSIAGAVNELPLVKGTLSTAVPPALTYVVMLLGAVLMGAFNGAQILFPAAAGQGLLTEMGRCGAPHFSRIRRGGLLTPAFAASAFRGLCLAGAMLGYDVLFYYIGRRYLGVWSPAGPRYSDILATPAPWLYPLTISVMAGFSEEYTFRLFGMSLARRYLRWMPAAVLLPAMVWAFAHSNYPVFPVWTRGIELTVMGALLGLVFWRYDIETTVVAHYTYDAFLVGWPLLFSGNAYYVASGAAVTLLALVPAGLGLVASRRGDIVEPPEAEVPRAVAVDEVVTAPLADRGSAELDQFVAFLRRGPRLWLGIGLLGLALAGALSPRVLSGPLRTYTVSADRAVSIAREYLGTRGFGLDGYSIARDMAQQPFAAYVSDVAPEHAAAISREYGGERWTVRFYRPLEPVDYWVSVDPRTGAVLSFMRNLPRDAAGARLEPDSAKALAEEFLRSQGAEAEGLSLVVSSATSRDQRTDHTFVWESADPRLPETKVRRGVVIQGEQAGRYDAPYVYVPETWERQREAENGWLLLAGAILGVGGLVGRVLAVIYLVRKRASLRIAGLLALGSAALLLPAIAARWPAAALNYDTEMVWSAFLAAQGVAWIFGPLVAGAAVAALWAVGAVVARRSPSSLPAGRAALAALATAGVSLGAGALFQLAGLDWAGPALGGPPAAGGWLGLLQLLAVPVGALAVECLFRGWLQGLLTRWLRSRSAALVAQAAVVGLLIGFRSGPGAGVTGLVTDGLVYGVAFLAGGLPVAAGARTVATLAWLGLALAGAGMAPAAAAGYGALALALAGPLLIWLPLRSRTASESE